MAQQNRWWIASYRLDSTSKWRYVADGERVPGARTLTVEGLWRPRQVNPDSVAFPVEVIRGWQEFGWAKSIVTPYGAREVLVEVGEWELHRDVVAGLTAPELTVAAMVGVNQLASLFHVQPKTVTSYVARGYLPAATFNRGRSPLWSIPVLTRTLAALRITNRSSRRPPAPSLAPTSERMSLAAIDELLGSLGIDPDSDDDPIDTVKDN
jgi:hypothetical protein